MIKGEVNLVKKILFAVFKFCVTEYVLFVGSFLVREWCFFGAAYVRILQAILPLRCTDIQWNLNFVASRSKCVSAYMQLSRSLHA